VQISPPGPTVSEKQLGYWTGLMKEQDMLKTNVDVAKLIAK
jgi:NitT/TauT family transport system substrate-binding protein